MNIVIPMAGKGRRFVEAGYAPPKPLIDVLGEPMFAWALKSLPLHLADRLIFICLREHLDGWALGQEIRRRYASYNPSIIPVSEVTEGQACTVLLGREYIDSQEGLIIHNADTYFRSSLEYMLMSLDAETMGIISVFEATGERWSFAKVDESGYVVEVAEKRPISTWATTGMYYFRHGRDFVSAADEMIRRDLRVSNEFYVGPVYNLLIAEREAFVLDIADEMWCMGTPDDLQRFLRGYQEENRQA